MAVALEDLRHHHSDYLFGREVLPPGLHDASFPPGTYLERLNPLAPRPHEDHVPTSIDLSFLTPNIEAVFAASQAGNSEDGQNIYFNSRNRRYYAAESAHGLYADIPDLAQNLYDLAAQGYYPAASMHTHPDEYLPFPTLDDWMPTLQQWENGRNIPLLNTTIIIGSGVQVMAQMTEQSHRLLTDRACRKFRDSWGARFEMADMMREKQGKLLTNQGIIFPEIAVGQTLPMDQAQDEIRIALAEAINAKMFVSFNMAEFNELPPRGIVTLLREHQQATLLAA